MTPSGLVNLLELSLESRSESLRETWPHPLDSSLTGHNGITWTAEDKAAVDIAVLIIRAINAHCDPLDPSCPTFPHGLEERRRTEEKIYLLRYSWYSTPGGVTENVLRLQKQLCQRVLQGKSRLTFERLIECPVMVQSFWSRWELQAWSLTEEVCGEGAAEWTEQRITTIPTVGGRPDAKESSGEVAVIQQLAYRSLLKWKWDGKTKLADFLTSKVKLEWTSADGKVRHRGKQTWPYCLRVKFDPRGLDDAPRFADLARITLHQPTGQQAIHYRLLATVKLGGEGRRDFVRIYDSDCRDARPVATQAVALPYIDNEWELGQPGSRYMLYYLNCEPELVSLLVPKEVSLHSLMETEHIEQLKAMRDSVLGDGGPEPLPYGRITLGGPAEDPGSQGDRRQSDPWDQDRDASASAPVDEGLRDPSARPGSKGQDPRAKTQRRVEENGGDIAKCFGYEYN